MVTLPALADVLMVMANVANERAEYYTARASRGGKPAPAAEAVCWTLRAMCMAGAQRCLVLDEQEKLEEQKRQAATRAATRSLSQLLAEDSRRADEKEERS